MIPLGILASSVRRASADPHWDNVVALLHFDGPHGSTAFTDETGRSWSHQGNAILSTVQSYFGPSSLYLDGLRGSINTGPAVGVFDPTDDFTVEAWVYPTESRRMTVFHNHTDDSNNSLSGMSLYVLADGRIQMNIGSSSGWNSLITYAGPLAAPNTWTHVAAVELDSIWLIFVNGVQVLSSTIAGVPARANARFYIGLEPPSAERDWKGWIDEFRFTQGVARYTENFTPPTAPFPNQ